MHSPLHDLQGKVIIEAKKDEKLEVPDEATVDNKVRPDPWIVHLSCSKVTIFSRFLVQFLIFQVLFVACDRKWQAAQASQTCDELEFS